MAGTQKPQNRDTLCIDIGRDHRRRFNEATCMYGLVFAAEFIHWMENIVIVIHFSLSLTAIHDDVRVECVSSQVCDCGWGVQRPKWSICGGKKRERKRKRDTNAFRIANEFDKIFLFDANNFYFEFGTNEQWPQIAILWILHVREKSIRHIKLRTSHAEEINQPITDFRFDALSEDCCEQCVWIRGKDSSIMRTNYDELLSELRRITFGADSGEMNSHEKSMKSNRWTKTNIRAYFTTK